MSILAPEDAGDAGEARDAQPPTELACSRTISEVCADDGVACPYPTLADAMAARCSGDPHPHITLLTCGVFEGAVEMQIDTSRTFYFEHGGGKLVAIVWDVVSRGSRTCTAGPASFAPPTCSVREMACPDASGVQAWL